MATRLGISRMHVGRLAKSGAIPGARRTKGGHWFWLETEGLRQWLDVMRLRGGSGNSTLSKACDRHHNKNQMAALAAQYNEARSELMAAAKKAAHAMVGAINERREMGFLLKSLLGRERVTRNSLRDWLRENPGELHVENIDWLMDTVRVSNRLVGGKLKRLKDAPSDVLRICLESVADAVRAAILKQASPTKS